MLDHRLMAGWDTLFDRFQSVQSVRRSALEQKEALAQQRRNFDQWVQNVIPPLFSEIQAHAEAKAELFYEKTGERIAVHPFKHFTRDLPEAPWLAYLKLGLSTSRLYLFATRGNGSGLYVHMIPSDANWAQGNQRVVTSAGCEVTPAVHTSQYQLQFLKGDASGAGPMALDTLVYRAFDVLVTAHAQHLLDAR